MYTKLTVTIESRRELNMAESPYRLSQLIGFAMLKDESLKALHGSDNIKPYVYDGLYPFEKDRTIKAGKLYVFHIKSPYFDLMSDLGDALTITESPFFKVIHTSTKNIEPTDKIKSIRTLTPTSSLIEDSPWTKEMGIMPLMDRIIKNTSHKYNLLFNEDIPHENWFTGINIISEKPISLKYKCKYKGMEKCKHNSRKCNKYCSDYNPMGIIGYKIELQIADDEDSQEIAWMLLSSGVLEKNAVLGMGYAEVII